ncbi:hypothetical protein SCLCIDRAFT_271784 [Scleroderma citrinum Foug A]|uniref:Uncharacterized protein n=1 Tax=Scleroderma citrinum Foug A TaxID=1036808 RepID=A0A0C3DI20_9AGAM|nr:hypothetical protein SCLCIDRAFT_271784 [Scleroderma citrinum Foug A]
MAPVCPSPRFRSPYSCHILRPRSLVSPRLVHGYVFPQTKYSMEDSRSLSSLVPALLGMADLSWPSFVSAVSWAPSITVPALSIVAANLVRLSVAVTVATLSPFSFFISGIDGPWYAASHMRSFYL